MTISRRALLGLAISVIGTPFTLIRAVNGQAPSGMQGTSIPLDNIVFTREGVWIRNQGISRKEDFSLSYTMQDTQPVNEEWVSEFVRNIQNQVPLLNGLSEENIRRTADGNAWLIYHSNANLYLANEIVRQRVIQNALDAWAIGHDLDQSHLSDVGELYSSVVASEIKILVENPDTTTSILYFVDGIFHRQQRDGSLHNPWTESAFIESLEGSLHPDVSITEDGIVQIGDYVFTPAGDYVFTPGDPFGFERGQPIGQEAWINIGCLNAGC